MEKITTNDHIIGLPPFLFSFLVGGLGGITERYHFIRRSSFPILNGTTQKTNTLKKKEPPSRALDKKKIART
jgi:hypothetical protein